MISTTEQFPFARGEIPQEARNFNYVRNLWALFLAPPPSLLPDEWAEKTPVNFNYSASLRGPCDFTGRNYLRRPTRDAANPAVRKQKKIFGRGCGKTLIGEIKKCYKLKFMPGTMGAVIWPSSQGEGSSAQYVNKRFSKTIKATKCLNDLIPAGQERFYINAKKVSLNGSYYGFFGAHSGGKVGDRLNDIDFDEIEKYPPTLKNEGSIINLIEGSTKGVAEYQIDYSSTPTIEDGLMWQAIQKSNLHLYFLPCPHCSSLARQATAGKDLNSKEITSSDHAKLIASILHRKKNSEQEEEDRAALCKAEGFKGWFIILFSEQYSSGWPTKMPDGSNIPIATVQFRYGPGFSKENPGGTDAKNRDGSWNYDRAMANAHILCPHCKTAIKDYEIDANGVGKIVDDKKIWMDANGCWICVKPGEPGDIGYMINSLYAPVINKESTWGGYVMEFISAYEEKGEAIRTFVNAILAGVFINQQNATISITGSENFATADWTALMTVDFQKNWPFLWFVIQRWSSFKLHPPFQLTNGKPHFTEHLAQNPALKKLCDKIVGGHESAWLPLAEILRFDNRTGQFPMLEFLASKNIIGEALIKIFRDQCNANTMDLGRFIYREMGLRMPKGGDAELIAAGHCELSGDDAWQELRDHQHTFGVGAALQKFGLHANRAVMIDSGYMEEHNPEVLRKCYESGAGGRFEWYDPMSKKFVKFKLHQFCRPVPVDCWIPFKGYPIRQAGRWKVSGIPSSTHWAPDDPFKGTMDAGKKTIAILESASEHYFRRWCEKRARQKEIREAIAAGKSYRGNIWNVANDCKFFGHQCQKREDLEAQLNNKGINSDGEIWERGSGGGGKRLHPDHLLDCASQMQESLAEAMGFYSYEAAAPPGNQQKQN